MFAQIGLGDVLSIASLVVGLVGGGFGIYISFRNRRTRIGYVSSGDTVISARPEDGIGVTFKGQPVERVTRSVLTLRNAGHTTISDHSIREPIAFTFDGEILDVNLSRSPGHSGATPTFLASQLGLKFQVLEPGQTIELEVLHSGERVEPISVDGYVEGAKNGIEDLATFDARNRLVRVAAVSVVVVVAITLTSAAIGAAVRGHQHSGSSGDSSPAPEGVLVHKTSLSCSGIHAQMVSGQRVSVDVVVPSTALDGQVNLAASMLGRDSSVVPIGGLGSYPLHKGAAPFHVVKSVVIPKAPQVPYLLQIDVSFNNNWLISLDCQPSFTLAG